jgi:hypothetical protein
MPDDRSLRTASPVNMERLQERADMEEHVATYAWFSRSAQIATVGAPLLLAFVLYWTT